MARMRLRQMRSQERDGGRYLCGIRAAAVAGCVFLAAGAGYCDVARVLDIGDSWVFFPYALQSPPALEEVLARPEFNLGQYREDGSIGLTNIFAEGWDTPEQLQKVADRLAALPSLDICHVSIGGNDFVHGWKQFMTPEQVDELFDEIIGHVRNIIQFCLDQRPDVRVAVIGYEYINLYDGFKINAFDEVWDYESITHWAVTYWGYPIPETKQQVLDIVREVHEVWVELERRKLEMVQEFDGRVTYVHNFGYAQHVHGVPSAGLAPGVVGIPDGPEDGYANFPNGRLDLYNPREIMKIDDGEMDPLHFNPEGFLTYYENIVRQCYAPWLQDSSPPLVSDVRPTVEADNPTDASQVTFEVKFSEAVTGVDLSDFALRTSESLSSATLESVSGSGSTYLVAVSNISGAGTVALDLIDDDTIYDAVWYPLKRTDDGSFRSGRPYWMGGGLLSCVEAAAIETQGASLYGGPLAANWPDADLDVNGIVDGFELALAARLLCDETHAVHESVLEAFEENREELSIEPGFASFETQADAIALFCTISTGLRDAIVTALALTGEYAPLDLEGNEALGALGDPDADERSNFLEYDWTVDQGAGRIEYGIAASTAGCGPADAPACPDEDMFDEEADAFFEALDQGIDWESADWTDNGIPDRFELALLSQIFCDGSHPLHDPLIAVYSDNRAALEADPNAQLLLPYASFLALFAAASQEQATAIAADLTLTAGLQGFDLGGNEFFDRFSDLDGDGASNDHEFNWAFIRGGGPKVYAAEASDPAKRPNAAIPNCEVAVTFENQGADFYDFAFQEGAWQIADADQSLVADRYEISVLAAILCDTTHPLHDALADVYDVNLAALQTEISIPFLASVFDIMAALATLSSPFATLIQVGLGLDGEYFAFGDGMDQPLSSLGDLDLDGRANYEEFADIGGLDAPVPDYVRAVMGSHYPPAPELFVDFQITNDSRPAILGTVHYATSLELSLDGTTWHLVQADGSSWAYFVPDPLPDGIYDVRLRAVGAFDREGQDTTTDELLIDTVAPEISLIGPVRLTTEAGEPYSDPGATASDDREGDITGKMDVANSVNTGLIDTFSVVYNVEDDAGNAALTVTRIVDVRDRTVPVITLEGGADINAEAAQPFVEPGYSALDTFSGDITADVRVTGTVDTAVPGDYVLSYDVRDANANDAITVMRTVHVVDTMPPEVTLIGGAILNTQVNQPFVDPGATALDALDGDVSASIVVDGFVDSSTMGAYELSYTASDAANNVSLPVIRAVHVLDLAAPVITILGDNPLTHEAATEYTDPGATALDDVDGDVTEAIQTVNEVNTSNLGTYSVTYAVSDGAGNQAEAVRTVEVVDTTPPVIVITGQTTVTHEAGAIYIDLGATAFDSRQGSLTPFIQAENLVDSSVPGSYTVTYNVSDSEGNAATPAVRTVNVVDTRKPTITMFGDSTITLGCFDEYVDPGASAYDAVDGDLTALIQVDIQVNPQEAGSYTITYTVEDSSGNAAVPRVRTVILLDDCAHTADQDGSFTVNLTELLRVIQFFNTKAHHCSPGTEDGYAPGTGETNCTLHDADYAPADWVIELTELLRIVQFFNAGGCYPCPGAGTEDGFCLTAQ